MDRMGVLGAAMESHSWGGELRDPAWTDEDQESRLLAALAAGTREAAERLVERTYRGVYGLLRRLCGDSDLAADLTQETYRKAWTALAGFHGRAQFSTWLCRIAYNVFLNHLRRPRRLVPLEERFEETIHDPSPAVDEVLGQAAEGDRLRRAVLVPSPGARVTLAAASLGGG